MSDNNNQEPENTPDTSNTAEPENTETQSKEVTSALKAFERAAAQSGTNTLTMAVEGLRYVRARLALSDKTQLSACVRVLTSRWQEHSDRVISDRATSDLIRLGATWELFSESSLPEKKRKIGAVPLRVVREFAPILREGERAEFSLPDRGAGSYVSLFADAFTKKLTGDEVASAVKTLRVELAREALQEAREALQQNPGEKAEEALRLAETEALKAGLALERQQAKNNPPAALASAAPPDSNTSNPPSNTPDSNTPNTSNPGNTSNPPSNPDTSNSNTPDTSNSNTSNSNTPDKPVDRFTGESWLESAIKASKSATPKDLGEALKAQILANENPGEALADLLGALLSEAKNVPDALAIVSSATHGLASGKTIPEDIRKRLRSISDDCEKSLSALTKAA